MVYLSAVRTTGTPRLIQTALMVLSALYLAGVWLEGVGSTLPSLLPRTPHYFLQIAALFPKAAVASIDYRAEAWLCKERAWKEIQTVPYFPLDPDDKENRFQRVMHFYRDNRPTMHALDDYFVDGHNSGAYDDGISKDERIGGIRVLSLRLTLPKPGEPPMRAVKKPLDEYPPEVRKNFYHTISSKRAERCGGSPEPSPPETPAPEPSE